ncbi:glycosyltransferase [Bacillus cereus]
MSYPTISLCMIVKDEENWISNCLNSVANHVDEIIIVDTGSTDQTVEICKKFHSKIFHFDWDESFANARNYGLEHASSDWILWLDADEELDVLDTELLKKEVSKNKEELLLSIHLINYVGSKKCLKNSYQIAHARLFKNHVGIKFVNNIHETLNVQEIKKDIHVIKTLPIIVHHYGYMDSIIEKKKKHERNINMLQKELLKSEYSPWIEYHIASEYCSIKEYEKAFSFVNRSIIHFIHQNQLPPSFLYRLKYSILLCLNSFEGAWPGINSAINLYPDYVDLYFIKGLILFYKNEYVKALEVFESCLMLGENNLKYLICTGVGSYLPMYYKGCCFEKIGDYKEAEKQYKKAIKVFPEYEEALTSLRQLKNRSH